MDKPTEQAVTKLADDVNKWVEKQRRRLNEAKRQKAIKEGLSAEHKAMDDEYLSILNLHTDRSSRSNSRSHDDMARELEEFQDVEIPRSPTPYSLDRGSSWLERQRRGLWVERCPNGSLSAQATPWDPTC